MYQHEKVTNELFQEEFNKAQVCGVIEDEFELTHEIYNEKFYETIIKIRRLSGYFDYMPIMVAGALKDKAFKGSVKGCFVKINGQIRSYNRECSDGRRHLDIILFAKDIVVYESKELFETESNTNDIYLEGYISKEPVFRTTPFGRCITDFMICVNRSFHKKDYIPCIAWGEDAKYIFELQVGDRIKFIGRVQSREYQKIYADTGEKEVRRINEISIMKLLED